MSFLSSIGNFIGGLLNNVTGVTDIANRSYQDQVKLWNMQNQYNTPAAQLARMKEAGIDVNPMTYAVGNGNMSTTAGSISSPSYSGSGVNPIAQAMAVMNGIADVRNKGLEAQIMDQNLQWAKKNNLPVGQMPSIEKTAGELVNSTVNSVKNKGFKGTAKSFWHWLTK